MGVEKKEGGTQQAIHSYRWSESEQLLLGAAGRVGDVTS
jgi:hypothetical protein